MEPTSSTYLQPRLVAPPASGVERAARKARPGLRRFLLSMSPAAWACLDALIIGCATCAAHTVLVSVSPLFAWLANPWLLAACFCLSITMAGLVFGLYERRVLMSRGAIILRTALTLALGVVLSFAVLSVLFYAYASRWVGLAVVALYALAALPLRLLAHEVVASSRVRVLCVGSGESVRKLVGSLGGPSHPHYEIVGHVRAEEGVQRLVAATPLVERRPRFRSEDELRFEDDCPCLGRVADLADVLTETGADEVVVGTEVTRQSDVERAAALCLERRCRVTDQSTFVEKLLGEVPAESIRAEWFLKADVQNHGSYEAAKRILDVCVAGLGLLLALPLAPLIALAIRLDGRGPVLFRQIRVGQYGACFTMYKFRTMRVDAEKDGARWAQQNDERVTRMGRFLRRTRLDELPQIVNILRGDMSLVGPRPERPEFVHNLEQLLPHYRLRHLVKPGLTGWAQINYRYGSSVADAHRKLCYDLYYLKHRSLDMDVGIIIRTCGTFLLGAR